VYRVTDVIGTSTQSWEDAAATAVKTASETLPDLRVAEVVEQDLRIEDKGGEIIFRTKLRLSFRYDVGHAHRPVVVRPRRDGDRPLGDPHILVPQVESLADPEPCSPVRRRPWHRGSAAGAGVPVTAPRVRSRELAVRNPVRVSGLLPAPMAAATFRIGMIMERA